MVTYQPSAFGAMLKHHRKAAGLTQEELAEAARLSARAISDLERGVRRTPYRDTVQQLADALALSAEDRASLSAAARPGAQSATEPPTERQDRAESIRTILIADIRDYTRFTAEHGDEAAARLTSRFAAIAADGVAGYDGRLVEAGGDEVVAVFSSARQALRAAIGLQERFAAQTDADPTTPLSVGIGLDAGEVVPVGDGYRGGALNLAARLCALAGPNEILASDGVVHLARRVEGVATIDRGAVQLKGLQEPMRVIQIAPEGQLPEDLPPLQPALAGRRTSLPDEPTPFIGREREIREVRALLGQPHTRLVTLLGPGGTGKTRLATRVGSSLLDDFRDGVVFVSLAPLVDPALVPSAIAGVLGLKEEASSALTGTLFRHLQDKQLLLILDNFEHVLAAAPVVAELLDVCRQLHVLSTSRIPLHLSWEQEYPVPPLAIPDPRQIAAPEQLAQYEAVRLFIERARAVRPEFELTNENGAAVAEICTRLDGLPLALELAAARLRLFPPQALLRRLSQSLQLLTGGAHDLPIRHQTLRGAIDWSYGLLSDEEKGLFARLAVFRGGCTLEAIAAVSDSDGHLGGEVLDGVASLVEKSLLRQDSSRVPELEGDPRFVMLETIRAYAAERLEESDAAEEILGNHARYYLSLAEETASRIDGEEQRAWFNRLEVERDNLRVALQWARENGDVDVGLRLAIALQGFWMVRGPLSRGRRWLEGFAAGDKGSRALQAAALSAAGRLAAAEGRRRESTELIERSLVLYRELGDRRGAAEAVGWLPMSWHMLGEAERAADLLRQGELEGRETGDQALLALSLRFQAALAAEQGDPQRTQQLGEESLALYRGLDDSEGRADVLRILAAAAYGAGERERARALTDDLLALLLQSPLDPQTEEWLEPLAYRARMLGDYMYATRILDALETRAQAAGDRRITAHARAGLGLLAREQGDYGRAAVLYNESAAVLQEVGDLLGRCRALIGLSDVARDQGDAERVIELCEESLSVLREIGDTLLTAFALHSLGLAAWYQGDRDRAEHLLAESLSALQSHKKNVDAAEVHTSIGLLALDTGQYDRAASIFTECLVVARSTESRWIMGTLLEGMAGVAAGTRHAERAAWLFGAAEALRRTMGTPRWPALESLYDRSVAAAATALGQERFLHALERGRAMALDQAVSFALQEVAVP